MHTFYVEADASGTLRLMEEESRHARKVLRLENGAGFCALDGQGHRWRATLEAHDAVRILEELPDNEPRIRLTVYQGLTKADKLEWIAQKLTELGACAIVPVVMERSVVREGGRREERLQRIAREAVKQCRRARIPVISEALTWKKALPRMRTHDLTLIPWEEQHALRIGDLRENYTDAVDIALVIGPEGGMSADEINAIQAVGGRCVTLGKRILRAETAAIASAAAVMTLWGEL